MSNGMKTLFEDLDNFNAKLNTVLEKVNKNDIDAVLKSLGQTLTSICVSAFKGESDRKSVV